KLCRRILKRIFQRRTLMTFSPPCCAKSPDFERDAFVKVVLYNLFSLSWLQFHPAKSVILTPLIATILYYTTFGSLRGENGRRTFLASLRPKAATRSSQGTVI